MTSSVDMNSLSREANSEVGQGLAISCEAETSVGIELELELAFGSILWSRWKCCVVCGWSLVLLPSFFSFKWLYQRFLTSLSVRPGRWAAILAQLQHNTKTQTDQTIISYDNGKVWGWFSLPIPIERVEADDGVVFHLGEVLSLDIRIQMVLPPLPTTLTFPVQPCQLCYFIPRLIVISAFTFNKPLVFFLGPSWSRLHWSFHYGFPCRDGRN